MAAIGFRSHILLESSVAAIDFHSHILPEIDDGSQSIGESLQLLRQEQEQGISIIAATPHFNASMDSIEEFQSRRDRSYARLMGCLDGELSGLRIYVGAEVFYFPGISESEVLPQLCIGNTSALLLEMPFMQWTEEMKQDIEKMVAKQGLFVILAHVERYYKLQKKKKIWDEILALPVFAQINAGSFLDARRRRFCLRFLNRHPTLLGSDCHSAVHRPVNLKAARELIEDKLGTGATADIDGLGGKLLGGH